jgi:cytoskeletal protein CcmA (bactofilin family)
MFGSKKQPAIKSLLAHGTSIVGNVHFADGLRIDGHIKGDVVASSDSSILVISETAVVIGQIFAAHVIVNGRVQGPIHASVLLELQPQAQIEGDVHYLALEMHQGAAVAGQLKPMQNAAKSLVSSSVSGVSSASTVSKSGG